MSKGCVKGFHYFSEKDFWSSEYEQNKAKRKTVKLFLGLANLFIFLRLEIA